MSSDRHLDLYHIKPLGQKEDGTPVMLMQYMCDSLDDANEISAQYMAIGVHAPIFKVRFDERALKAMKRAMQ